MNPYLVKPGQAVRLDDHDPDDTSMFDLDKQAGRVHLRELSLELDRLQNLLYAEHRHKLLIILQGMDSSGKNGTIRHVFKYVDPLGVRVSSFKAPSTEELERDYLWRVHRRVPAKGEIVIFDRSHYEDVGFVRVHGLISDEVCQRRYAQIRDFERMLVEEGTTILKFFLHIDRKVQKKRLNARLEKPHKRWKYDSADMKERAHWEDYMQAYSQAISETSTDQAPWYVIPANHKWYRNLVVAQLVVDTLGSFDMHYPGSQEDTEDSE